MYILAQTTHKHKTDSQTFPNLSPFNVAVSCVSLFVKLYCHFDSINQISCGIEMMQKKNIHVYYIPAVFNNIICIVSTFYVHELGGLATKLPDPVHKFDMFEVGFRFILLVCEHYVVLLTEVIMIPQISLGSVIMFLYGHIAPNVIERSQFLAK